MDTPFDGLHRLRERACVGAGLTGRAAKTMQMNTLSAAGRSLLAGSLLEEEVSQEELLVGC